jgi:predicted permease
VPIATGFSRGREFLETPLTILLAIVGVVLLIACANVAALLIARSHTRRRELAVRLAIGASRGRLVRHLLAECLVISVAAGVLGLGIGTVGARGLTALTNAGRLQLSLHTRVDARMLAVTFGASLLTGLACGLAPAWSSTRFSLTSALTGAGRAGSLGGSRFRSGQVLVVVQIAMTLVLALGAGLLVKTLRNLETQNLGFDRDHVWMFFMETLQSGKRQAALAPVLRAADQRVAAIPGVLASAVSSDGVLSGFVGRRAVTVPGRTPSADEDINAEWNLIGPRFFHTLGIQVTKGRDFGPADTDTSPHVAIVNESMARYFFGSTDPIGQRFYFGQELSAPVEIVGVVANSKYFDARDDDVRMVYLPYDQDATYLYRLCVVVRTAGDGAGLLQRIRAELGQVDPAIPVGRVTSTAEQLDATLNGERMMAWLVGLFGVLAIALACIGLYGVMAGTAARRTREIGIRIAIGASRGSVLRAVLGEACRLTAAGIAIGVPCAFVAARSIQSQLYGVRATDPVTLTGAIALLVVVTLAAAFLPAYRASRVNPVVALRTE